MPHTQSLNDSIGTVVIIVLDKGISATARILVAGR